MKTRQHHNNKGQRQVKTGRTAEQVKRMARRIGVPFGRRPTCPRCHFGGYRQSDAWDGRPQFECTLCDHTWTCGRDGGAYVV